MKIKNIYFWKEKIRNNTKTQNKAALKMNGELPQPF